MTAPAVGFVRAPRRRTRQRRFLVLSVAGLAVLVAVLGVSFAGPTGSSTVSVSASSNSFVYPIANSASLPTAVNALKYTPLANINQTTHTVTTSVLPGWSPTANSAGSVTTAGDLAVIDAATTGVANAVIVNVYVTNLPALQLDYSSFALPFNVYSSPCTAGSCTWTQASGVVASPPTYMTNTTAFVSFSLPAGSYYDIAVDTGGSFYCLSTTASGGSLSPSFYFAAQST